MTARKAAKLPSAGQDWMFDADAGQIVQVKVPDGLVRATCGRHTWVVAPVDLARPCRYGGWCNRPLRELSDKRQRHMLAELRRPRPTTPIDVDLGGGPL